MELRNNVSALISTFTFLAKYKTSTVKCLPMFEMILITQLVFTMSWLHDRKIDRGDQNIACKVKES